MYKWDSSGGGSERRVRALKAKDGTREGALS